MPIDSNVLLNEARCLGCGSLSEAEMIIAALLQRIAESGGGGGGSQFSEGAGAPVASPSAPDAPAQYFDTTSDFTYNWNIGTQAWVPVPKVYRALMTQSGANAPVATVLENTIGAIVWSRLAVGIYSATLVGAFPLNKSMISGIGLEINGDLVDEINRVTVLWDSANTVRIVTQFGDFASGWLSGILSNSDNILGATANWRPIEILVYP